MSEFCEHYYTPLNADNPTTERSKKWKAGAEYVTRALGRKRFTTKTRVR